MKKINSFVLLFLTFSLGVFLCACSFKKPEVIFSQNEVVLSCGETLDLQKFVTLKNVSSNKITYRFSNPNLFSANDQKFVATQGGKAVVYAVCDNSSLASMNVIVRKPFDAVTNIQMNSSALITWDAVSGIFEGDTTATIANSYTVSGHYIDESGVTTSINQVVYDPQFQLTKNGIYTLSISANANGYFSSSALATKNFSVGFMPQLTQADFDFEDGVLSWDRENEIKDALYQVVFDGQKLPTQMQNFVNLTSRLETASAGLHTVSLIVTDISDNQERKLTAQSENIYIRKLTEATVNFVNGEMNFACTYANSFEIFVDGKSFQKTSENKTTLAGLSAGEHSVVVVPYGSGFVFHGNASAQTKVYKLATPSLRALEGNVENSNSFNMNASILSANNFDTYFEISWSSSKQQVASKKQVSCAASNTETDFDLTVDEAGTFQATASQLCKSSVTQNGAHIINSDVSESLTLVKLAAFTGEATHRYENGVSVISANHEGGAAYSLLRFDGRTYQEIATSSKPTFTLTDKIENLFSALNGKFSFKIVAKAENETASISSSVTKDVALLEVPTVTSASENFSWRRIEDSNGYSVKVFQLSESNFAAYVANKDALSGFDDQKFEFSISESGIENKPEFIEFVSDTAFNILHEGYYVVCVQAISAGENETVVKSDAWAESSFIITKQLEIDADFGYDKSLIGKVTGASGYFVQIAESENVTSYTLTLTNTENNTSTTCTFGALTTTYYDKSTAQLETISDGQIPNYTLHLLGENFKSGTYNLSVTANGSDSRIYLTSTYTLQINRLAGVTKDDVTILDFLPKQTLTVKNKVGVTNTLVKLDESNFVSTEGTAVFEITGKEDFSLQFTLSGTELSSNIYQVQNGIVYLSSETTTLDFKRLEKPTDLQFNGGLLTFKHPSNVQTEKAYYVLDIDGGDAGLFSVRLDSTISAVFTKGSILQDTTLSNLGDIIKVDDEDNEKVSVDLNQIIALLKTSSLGSHFNQAQTLKFSIYAYQTKETSGQFVLSSKHATAVGTTQDFVQVEEMPELVLQFNKETRTLSWKTTSGSNVANATYTISGVFEEINDGTDMTLKEVTTTENSYHFANEIAKNYEIRVIGTSGSYLGSSTSNTIKIIKLDSLSNINLTKDAKLSFAVPQNCSGVSYVLTTETRSTKQNAPVTNGTCEISITDAGEYAITLLAPVDSTSVGNVTTYYIDSFEASWQLKDLSKLAPNTFDVTIADSSISWQPLTETLNAVNYLLIFKDELGNIGTFTTTSNSVNWQNNAALRGVLSGLEGQYVSLTLLAHVNPYSERAGGTIYFAPKQTDSTLVSLLESLQGVGSAYNFLLYENEQTTLEKLSSPKIENVEFVDIDEVTKEVVTLKDNNGNAYLSSAPHMKVEISGDFGERATFQIFREDSVTVLKSFEDVEKQDGVYVIYLSQNEYSNVGAGESTSFDVYVVSDGQTFPSSSSRFSISKAHDLKSVSFADAACDGISADLGFAHTVEIEYDKTFADEVLGGVVLEVLVENGTETQTYTYLATDNSNSSGKISIDISDLLETFENGCALSFSAYINSSNLEENILASNTNAAGKTYQMLSSVNNITQTESGFVILDETNENVSYLLCVTSGAINTNHFVSADANGVFVVPTSQDVEAGVPAWTDGEYNITVQATQSGKVISAKYTFVYTFSRMDQVQNVLLTRDESDISKVTLSWDAVAGANKYAVDVYENNNGKRGTLLASKEISTTSCLISEFLEDANVESNKFRFEIVTKGESTGKIDSVATVFIAKILENNVSISNFEVDEFGKLLFKVNDGQAYMFRFVSYEGLEIVAAGNPSAWKKCQFNGNGVATLDTSILEALNTAYNIEVKAYGSSSATLDEEMILDSETFSTKGTFVNFFKLAPLTSVNVNALDGTIEFVHSSSQLTQIYMSVSEDGIDLEDVILVDATYSGKNGDNEFIYTQTISEILSRLEKCGLSAGTHTIYLWAYVEGSTNETYTNLHFISNKYSCDVTLSNDAGFTGLSKEDEQVFANFSGNSSQLSVGVFVKVMQQDVETESEFEFNTFVAFDLPTTLEDLLAMFSGEDFSINLSQLFENQDLIGRFGNFTIQFARVSITQDGALKYLNGDLDVSSMIISNWQTATWTDTAGVQHESIDKIQNVPALVFANGSLNWSNPDELATKFKLFFYSDYDNKIFTNDLIVAAAENVYTPSDFLVGGQYCISVQGLNEEIGVLSSSQVFVLDGAGKIKTIMRNEIVQPLTLSGGTLSIAWEECDFISQLRGFESGSANLAQAFMDARFTSPISFNVLGLANGSVKIRMRFTSTQNSTRKTFDIPAIVLLESLPKFWQERYSENLENCLTNLTNSVAELGDTDYNAAIKTLVEAILNGSYGIANSTTIFDTYLERLQTGEYSLDYCLIGADSLNSAWYDFENAQGENLIYVNSQPNVKIKKVPDQVTKYMNTYFVLIEKSKIYEHFTQYVLTTDENAVAGKTYFILSGEEYVPVTFEDGEDFESGVQYYVSDGKYQQTDATNYVLKLGNRKFSIYLSGTQFKLCELNVTGGETISVEECDANGQYTDTTHLKFYLNYNNGDCFLAKFASEQQVVEEEFQIYAVGNDVSASSKSEYFTITFLDFGDFAVKDGSFAWTTTKGFTTTVVSQKSNEIVEAEPVPVEVDASGFGKFSLDGKTLGRYSLKFVVEGKVEGNNIYVDSSIAYAPLVYKLEEPTLSTNLGNILIRRSSYSQDYLALSYSSKESFGYLISNNYSANLSLTLFDNSSKVSYQPGLADLTESDDDFRYKSTEERATQYYVSMLGSSAAVDLVKETNLENYYIKNIIYVDESGQAVDKQRISLSSANAPLDASMAAPITNIKIVDGVIVWDAVSQKEDLEIENPAYKVTIEKYNKSETPNGTTNTNADKIAVFHTTETRFDITTMYDSLSVADGEFLKVIVQVFGSATENPESENDFGSPQYVGSNQYILLSHYTISSYIADITRMQSVENLCVTTDGRLSWKFTPDLNGITAGNISEYYKFIVVDDENKEISGSCSFRYERDGFTVVFSEETGEMKVGTYEVKVFVVGTANYDTISSNFVVKSKAESVVITKLATVQEGDFEVYSVEPNLEALSFEKYFERNPDNTLKATIAGSAFTFSKDNDKIYILGIPFEEFGPISYEGGFVGYVEIISSDEISSAEMFFIAEQYSTDLNICFSDTSGIFTLLRDSTWENGQGNIVWNETTGQFDWNYDFFSINSSTKVQEVSYVLSAATVLYADEGLSQATDINLQQGREISVVKVGSLSTQIMHNNTTYFIENTAYTLQQQDASTLNGGILFTILQDEGDTLVISFQQKSYRIAASAVVSPTFIVELRYYYSSNQSNVTVRTYTTTDRHFAPPAMNAYVKISIRIKLASSNLLSKEYSSQTVLNSLFAGGEGVKNNPFKIASAAQFQNIAYRMQKDEILNTYVNVEGETVVEENKNYYFQLERSINLTFEGIMFAGDFGGVIYGQNNTITFVSTNVQSLTGDSTIRVEGKHNLVPQVSGTNEITYQKASALFENLTSSAQISDLNLAVTFGQSSVRVTYNSLMAALAITSSAQISGVNVTSFASNFVSPNQKVLAYGGIAAKNTGTISNCTNVSNISLTDGGNAQLIFVGGIAYINSGKLENCTTGSESESLKIKVDCGNKASSVQIGGVIVTNADNGEIRGCTNRYNIEVSGPANNTITCKVAGVVVLGKNTVSDCYSDGSITVSTIPNAEWAKVCLATSI